jgi:hypothetical protein
MMQRFSYLSIRSILSFSIALLSVTSFTLSIHAQKFRPIPVLTTCNAFVEGKGLYVFGGIPASGTVLSQAFMLDLSVPWNASDPVFKELVDVINASPLLFPSCTLLPNGQDILQIVYGTVYLYNTISASWKTAFHNTLPFSPALSAADPESGLVYVIQNDWNSAGNGTMHAIDLKAQTTNSLMIPGLSNLELFREAAWNTHLKSVLVTSTIPNAVYVFTPSKVSESSHGWRLQNTKGDPMAFGVKSCFLPLGDGSKMVFVGMSEGSNSSIMRILDVATWTWTTRTTIPHPGSNACAISGDQFIVWGGYENTTILDTAAVFNMKTDKWVTNYIAPTTTTVPSSTSQAPIQNTPTTISEPGDTPSSEKKLVTIIIVVTGVLLAIILTIIAVYLRSTKRSRTDTSSIASNDTTSDCEVSPDSLKKQKLYKSVLSGRLHLGPFGARSLPEQPHAVVKDLLSKRSAQEGAIEVELISQHPHAIVEDLLAKRNVQEGVIEMELLPRHPHAMAEEGPITQYHDKMEWVPARNWGGKEELDYQ